MGVLYANSNNYEKALIHHELGRYNAEMSGNVPLTKYYKHDDVPCLFEFKKG
jgi:hypothetical protein